MLELHAAELAATKASADAASKRMKFDLMGIASSPVAIRIDARLLTARRPAARGQRPLPARTFAISRADLRHRAIR